MRHALGRESQEYRPVRRADGRRQGGEVKELEVRERFGCYVRQFAVEMLPTIEPLGFCRPLILAKSRASAPNWLSAGVSPLASTTGIP